ncbi:MAG: TlpA family protein disulfide reductase [Bryobacteraceae bacterium]
MLFVALHAGAQTSAGGVWNELKAKREGLTSLHQEFEVAQTFKTAHGNQLSKRQIVLDMAHGQWRERTVGGSGNMIRIFDGQNLFRMEEGGDEYVRSKRQSKEEDPAPSPYSLEKPDWGKAVEMQRVPCGIPGSDHQCVVLDVPLKKWSRLSSDTGLTKLLGGSARIALDTVTGLLLSSRTVQAIDNGRGVYQSDVTYKLQRMSWGKPAEASLFAPPSSEMREVRELAAWNAARLKKQLAGKPAPELAVNDIQGKPIALSDLKGKTVLLDFWTTWCVYCRANSPALEKLYSRYGGKNLAIIGFSVSEEREIVERYLKEHPHGYPVVLTSENEMPRPYQVHAFPTYMVIDPDGTFAAAVEGDQSFGELRHMLKKAGLELE